ncbi:MAG: peptidylprolyl isomerase [Acidobacteria bacterium]|nr:peptidylprolyl isomerase [Acidobacteriota bacterium]
MAEAKQGDTVRVHYTGTLASGEVFDSSRERDPLEFQLGAGMVVPGFDAAVNGMSEGETVRRTIPAAEAYGPRRDDLTVKVERERVPENVQLEIGGRLQIQTPDGRVAAVTVTEITDDSVHLDANHPLAGKDLTFEIELVEVKAA